MSLVAESWRGQRPLATVFWGYYVLFYFTFVFTLFFLISALPESLTGLVLVPGVLFLLVYNVWALVSIWRCAKNSSSTARTLARAWVVLVAVGFPVRVLIALPHYQEYTAHQRQASAGAKQP